ncbi:MAG: hypothetical protein ABI972_30960 [Acidobacteriota bacterium]
MTDYMSEYGAEDERRADLRRKIGLIVLALVAILVIWWAFFRNRTEERQLSEFVDALRTKNFQKAYTMWGCTSRTPCDNYPYPKFLEDWGSEGRYKDAGSGTIVRSGHTGSAARRFLLSFKPPDDCPGSIIRILRTESSDLTLIVNRETGVIGFSPWPVCDPRVRVSESPQINMGK